MKKLLVILLAVAMAAAIAVPAMAAGPMVKVGGRMLTDIGYWNRSKELMSSGSSVGTAFVNVPGHSYLRAIFTAPDKTTGGFIELGLASLQPSATVSLRYAYGWYKIGNCKITAGQTDNLFGTLAAFPRQNVGLNNNFHLLLFGWGKLWPHRVPQARIFWDGGMFSLQFALEEPRAKSLSGITGDFYYTFPRASLVARVKAGGFVAWPGFNFVQHKFELPNGTTGDDSYNTWAFAVPIKFVAGAFTVKADLHYGYNFRTEYPFYPAQTAPIVSATGEIEDTKTWGGFLSFEYKMGNMILAVGGGYERFENDKWKDWLGYKDDNQSRYAFFVSLPTHINKYFLIQPEFSYYNYGDNPSDGSDAGTEWMLGMQFSFVF